MKKEIYLNTLSKDSPSKDEDVLCKDYRSEMISRIERDGIFFSLFNKMFDKHGALVPHLLLSRFDLFRDDEIYYRLTSKKTAIKDRVLLLFHLDPLHVPLNALEDFLKWFKTGQSFKKISAHFSFSLDLTSEEHQKYLHDYYALIVRYLGLLPDSMTTLDLEKSPELERYTLLEAGSLWACLDNYIVHLVLSRGGQYILPGLDIDQFEIIEREELSAFHEIQKVRIKRENVRCDLECSFAEDLQGKNFFMHPEDMKSFNYLMYQNILK